MGLTRRRLRMPGTQVSRGVRVWLIALLVCSSLEVALGAFAATGPGNTGAPSESPDLDERVREVASELRCVVCQNLSVADSPSDLAKEMRNLIRELLQQGKTPDEIKAYFQSRYGDFVLLEPPKRGFNLLVWGLPFVALGVGACGVYLVAKRWTMRKHESAPPLDPVYAERVRRELKEREGSSGP